MIRIHEEQNKFVHIVLPSMGTWWIKNLPKLPWLSKHVIMKNFSHKLAKIVVQDYLSLLVLKLRASSVFCMFRHFSSIVHHFLDLDFAKGPMGFLKMGFIF